MDALSAARSQYPEEDEKKEDEKKEEDEKIIKIIENIAKGPNAVCYETDSGGGGRMSCQNDAEVEKVAYKRFIKLLTSIKEEKNYDDTFKALSSQSRVFKYLTGHNDVRTNLDPDAGGASDPNEGLINFLKLRRARASSVIYTVPPLDDENKKIVARAEAILTALVAFQKLGNPEDADATGTEEPAAEKKKRWRPSIRPSIPWRRGSSNQQTTGSKNVRECSARCNGMKNVVLFSLGTSGENTTDNDSSGSTEENKGDGDGNNGDKQGTAATGEAVAKFNAAAYNG
jgi:hypothetical protein